MYLSLLCREEDVFLSYLPLAHIFDRVAEEALLAKGGSIGYWQGDVKQLMDDVGALRPTIFVGVPRIFDRIYSGVKDKVRTSCLCVCPLFLAAYGRRRRPAPHHLFWGVLYFRSHLLQGQGACSCISCKTLGQIIPALAALVRFPFPGVNLEFVTCVFTCARWSQLWPRCCKWCSSRESISSIS